MLDFEEKALCRKAGGILEFAAKKGYEPIAFTKLWLKSKTADNLYHWDFNDVAQSKQYLLHSVELEYGLTEEDCRENEEYVADMMYWCGYILMYLSIASEILPEKIYRDYDVEKILKSYDTLHTLSSNVAVDEIREQFKVDQRNYKYIQLAKQVRENPYITMRMNYMYKEELCTTIDVDFMHKKVYVENQTDNILHRAFGVVKDPDWERFEEFLESRCFPRSRANLKEILRDIGVDSYDPLQIIEKTGGRMAEDKQWIEIIYYDRRGSGEEWKK